MGTDQRAVVIGASLAGVLTARVLSRRFRQVTLVDRDELPLEPVARGGTPQARHVHGLLARGRSIVEDLFPGTTDDLVARGAVLGDAQADGWYVLAGSRLAPGVADLPVLAVSRPLLEWYLRRRLLTEGAGRITVLEHTSVLDLAFAAGDGRVDGVLVADRDGGEARLLAADLVVDASGRGSRTPEWLERRGYAPPPEEVRRIDKQYVTRTFHRTAEPGQPAARIVSATPDNPRGGILLANEGDRWVVGLAGMHGERPPQELEEFRAWARTLAAPDIADALEPLVPLDDGARYRFPANRRRHYELLDRFPEGLVVIGDALCVFDPVHGQGMTVAAVEAEELDRLIAGGGTTGLAARFHPAAARWIDTPWAIAAGGVDPDGGRPSLRDRLVAAYLVRLLRAAALDPALARAFLRVNHLVDRPDELVRLPVALRVLRGSVRRGTARHISAAVEAVPSSRVGTRM